MNTIDIISKNVNKSKCIVKKKVKKFSGNIKLVLKSGYKKQKYDSVCKISVDKLVITSYIGYVNGGQIN